jgi:hypothetical protein
MPPLGFLVPWTFEEFTSSAEITIHDGTMRAPVHAAILPAVFSRATQKRVTHTPPALGAGLLTPPFAGPKVSRSIRRQGDQQSASRGQGIGKLPAM